jgi:hypothetical protein
MHWTLAMDMEIAIILDYVHAILDLADPGVSPALPIIMDILIANVDFVRICSVAHFSIF